MFTNQPSLQEPQGNAHFSFFFFLFLKERKGKEGPVKNIFYGNQHYASDFD